MGKANNGESDFLDLTKANFKKPRFKFSEEEGDHIFFTSDSHFYHANIIKFCNRPFSSVEEMNKALIENWKAVVKPDDYIFHLGDFCFAGSKEWNELLDELPGKKILILGNHERKNLRQGYISKFEYISPQMQIQIGNRSIYLNHYPFLCYGGTYRSKDSKVWQLYGHVHSGRNDNGKGLDLSRLKYCFDTQYDVGVDNNNFTPISYNQLKVIMENRMNSSEANSAEANSEFEKNTNAKLRRISDYEKIEDFIEKLSPEEYAYFRNKLNEFISNI